MPFHLQRYQPGALRRCRTVVIARKVRPGESTSVDTSRINLNDDVIMPYTWYVNQGKEPHPYYTGGFQIPYPDVEPSAPGSPIRLTQARRIR